jgi:CTP:molybdopterin cytidylyltransferase MocA
MGRLKQLLPLPDRPAVRRCIESLFAGGVPGVIVVVAGNSPVASAVRDLPVRIVCNEAPASDMAGSVRAGLAAASPESRHILVSLADHPLVRPDTVRTILSESALHPGRIVIPRYQGRRGHPTLFPRPIISEVLAAGNLRDVISRHAADVHTVDVDDEGTVLDMDTEQDYRDLLRRIGCSD